METTGPPIPNTPSAVSGFILAGGRSSRFGSNKVLAEWQGRPLLDYALQALRDAGIEPRVVTADPSPLRHLVSSFVTGEVPDQGPVEAVRVALEAATTPWSLILTADMPEVSPLVRALMGVLPPTDPETVELVCYCDRGGRLQPFPGLYHRSLLTRGEAFPKSMVGLVESAASRLLSLDGAPGMEGKNRVFGNVNEPRDLDALGDAPALPESD